MKKQLSLLIFKENEWWVAQCLEYDIAAQAKTLMDVQYEFQRIFIGRIITCARLGIDPFKDLPRAPDEYQQFLEDSKRQIKVEYKPKNLRVPRSIDLSHLPELPQEAYYYER